MVWKYKEAEKIVVFDQTQGEVQQKANVVSDLEGYVENVWELVQYSGMERSTINFLQFQSKLIPMYNVHLSNLLLFCIFLLRHVVNVVHHVYDDIWFQSHQPLG